MAEKAARLHATQKSYLVRLASALCLLACSAYIFRFGFHHLSVAWGQGTQKLGPAILVLAAILFMREARLPAARVDGQSNGCWASALAVVAGLAAATAGTLVQSTSVTLVGLIMWTCGFVALRLGATGALRLWPFLAAVVLSLPMPGFIGRPVDQLLASAIDLADVLWGAALRGVFAAHPAEAFGTSGGVTPLVDAKMAAFVVSASFVIASLRLLSKVFWIPFALAMLAWAVALDATARWLPLFILRKQSLLTPELLFIGGLIVSMACLLPLVPGLRAQRSPGIWVRAFIDGSIQFFDNMVVGRRPRAAQVAAVSALALAALSYFAVHREATEPDRLPFSLFPPEIEGWRSSRTALAQGTEHVLAADDYLSATYYGSDAAATVDVFVAYYASQSPHKGAVHSPDVCLPNDDWEILSRSKRRMLLAGQGGLSLEVNRFLIEKNGQMALVYYWFEGRGKRFTSEILAKLDTKRDLLLKARSDGALVRLVTDYHPDDPDGAADQRLEDFLNRSVGHFARFLPR